MRKRQKAFTLIELMITVAIVAILATIAYPSYRSQILRSHRSEAKTALLQAQVEQEKYFLQNNTYGGQSNIGPKLGLKTGDLTANGYYKITITATNGGTGYTAVADAQTTGGQDQDTGCTQLGIDQTGTKTPSGTCWTR